jgi:hypothetical protein
MFPLCESLAFSASGGAHFVCRCVHAACILLQLVLVAIVVLLLVVLLVVVVLPVLVPSAGAQHSGNTKEPH